MSTDTHKPDGWSVLSNVAQNAEWRRFPSDNLRDLASQRLAAAKLFLHTEMRDRKAKEVVADLFRAATEAVKLLPREEAEKLARDVSFHITMVAKEKNS